MSLGLARRILSKEYAQALLRRNTFYLMNCNHHFLTLCDFVGNFSHIRKYYSSVVKLKNDLENRNKTIGSTSRERVQQSL